MKEKLKAVILDDDKIFAQLLKNRIECIAERYDLNFDIISYQRISELEINMVICDVLFLDIELQEQNGLTWIQKWQTKGRFGNIIFVSAYSKYVFQSFESTPIAFVRKMNLNEDLDRALALYKRRCSERIVTVSVPEGKKLHLFRVADILYIKGSGHYIEFYMAGNEKRILRGKMNMMEDILGQHGFIRIKISCLLNIKYIVGMDKNQVFLKNGEKIKVSSKYQEPSFEKLKLYLLNSGE